MASDITTISLPKDIKSKAQAASRDMLGYVNLSAYLKVLIDKDCKERNIK